MQAKKGIISKLYFDPSNGLFYLYECKGENQNITSVFTFKPGTSTFYDRKGVNFVRHDIFSFYNKIEEIYQDRTDKSYLIEESPGIEFYTRTYQFIEYFKIFKKSISKDDLEKFGDAPEEVHDL